MTNEVWLVQWVTRKNGNVRRTEVYGSFELAKRARETRAKADDERITITPTPVWNTPQYAVEHTDDTLRELIGNLADKTGI
jgi:hypothetical protein